MFQTMLTIQTIHQFLHHRLHFHDIEEALHHLLIHFAG